MAVRIVSGGRRGREDSHSRARSGGGRRVERWDFSVGRPSSIEEGEVAVSVAVAAAVALGGRWEEEGETS